MEMMFQISCVTSFHISELEGEIKCSAHPFLLTVYVYRNVKNTHVTLALIY